MYHTFFLDSTLSLHIRLSSYWINVMYDVGWTSQVVKNPPAMQETQVWSLGGEDLLEEGLATHSRILA